MATTKADENTKPAAKLMPLKLPVRSKAGGGGGTSAGLNLGGDLGGVSLGGGLGSFGDLGGLGGVDFEDEGEVDEQVRTFSFQGAPLHKVDP